MNPQYDISDVIIDRDNKEIKNFLNKECYVGNLPYECLWYANNNSNVHILKSINDTNLPFEIKTEIYSITNRYPCIIIKRT